MQRKELVRIIESVRPGVAQKEVNESMKYFFLSGKEIVSYNDQISIQHPLKTDFALFVKANDLLRVASKSSSDEIFMKEKDNKLMIKAGKVNASLATITDEEISSRINNVNKSLKKAKFKNLPDNFCECIQLCAFAASKSESDNTLTCIKITDDTCIAMDNRRLAKATLEGSMGSMFLKATEVNNLVNINPIEYSITKSWLHFKNEDKCTFSIRVVKGDFPDIASLFDFEGETVNFPKSILEGMEIASIFTDESKPSVNIKLENNVCLIKVSSESGKAQFKAKIKYKGKPIDFRINPDFLKDMMKHSTKMIVSDERTKLETENFSLVTVLFGD